MLIVDKHCSDVCYDEFPVPQIDRKSKQVKDFFSLQTIWRSTTRYFKYRKYQKLWMNNKVRGDKYAVCLNFLPHLLNSGRKIEFLIFQGSVASYLRRAG